MSDPYQVVRNFEKAVAEYTGAPYVVAVNSCTMALTLAVAWHLRDGQFWTNDGRRCVISGLSPARQCIDIPKRTYVSVPMSIIHAGGRPTFRDEEWRGSYRLWPLPVWDSARLFTGGMSHPQQNVAEMICVSFHAAKTLGDTQGGAILHDNPEADAWLRKARFDGRTEGVAPKDDKFDTIGWHCYMSPDVAARLRLKLHSLPKHNDPLPNDDYPDLSQMDIFK